MAHQDDVRGQISAVTQRDNVSPNVVDGLGKRLLDGGIVRQIGFIDFQVHDAAKIAGQVRSLWPRWADPQRPPFSQAAHEQTQFEDYVVANGGNDIGSHHRAVVLAEHEQRKIERLAYLDEPVENGVVQRELRGLIPHGHVGDLAEKPL